MVFSRPSFMGENGFSEALGSLSAQLSGEWQTRQDSSISGSEKPVCRTSPPGHDSCPPTCHQSTEDRGESHWCGGWIERAHVQVHKHASCSKVMRAPVHSTPTCLAKCFGFLAQLLGCKICTCEKRGPGYRKQIYGGDLNVYSETAFLCQVLIYFHGIC